MLFTGFFCSTLEVLVIFAVVVARDAFADKHGEHDFAGANNMNVDPALLGDEAKNVVTGNLRGTAAGRSSSVVRKKTVKGKFDKLAPTVVNSSSLAANASMITVSKGELDELAPNVVNSCSLAAKGMMEGEANYSVAEPLAGPEPRVGSALVDVHQTFSTEFVSFCFIATFGPLCNANHPCSGTLNMEAKSQKLFVFNLHQGQGPMPTRMYLFDISITEFEQEEKLATIRNVIQLIEGRLPNYPTQTPLRSRFNDRGTYTESEKHFDAARNLPSIQVTSAEQRGTV